MGVTDDGGIAAFQAYGLADQPKLVPANQVAACETYREAVRLCWRERRIKGMTMRTAAELSGAHPSHMSDYLADEKKMTKKSPRRNLPPTYINDFEMVCGNRAITQWLVRRSGLHLAEELMRAA